MSLFRFKFIVLTFLLLLSSSKSIDAQIISVNKDKHYYGDIEWKSAAICYFTITNKGNDDLIIFDIEYNKYYIKNINYSKSNMIEVLPGDSILLKIEYNTKRTGSFNKDIHIISNSEGLDNGEKTISVIGRVKSPAPILMIVIDFTIIILLYIGDVRFGL